ncbi:MAG: hypothetical protein U0R76_03295 [Candidatus Nanopelagicales bacterium]
MSSADPAATPVPPEADDGHDDVERPTVLQRARALWCQLVSGLG